MAVAFDAAAGGNNGGVGGSSYDFTGLTVGTGSDRYLVVGVTGDTNADGDVSSVTWDQGGSNQAMTKIGSGRTASTRVMTLWGLTNPASGNKTLRVGTPFGSDYVLVAASAYTGVKQTGQPDSHADSAGGASPQTGSTTVVATGCWLVMVASGQSGTTTAGTSTTYRAGDGFGGNITAIMDSNGTVSTGSQSLQATSAGALAWNIISLEPAAAGSSVTVTTPMAKRFYQRNGSNQASIAITGTYTGTPTAIEASFNSGSYATIDAAPSAGSFSGTLGSQTAGRGTLTVRFTNDTAVLSTVANIGIGDAFLVGGDSRAEGRSTNPQTGSSDVYYFRQDDAWASGNDPADTGTSSGSIWPLVGVLIATDQSVPAAFITAGLGSSDVAGSTNQWATGNSGLTELLAQATAAATGTSGFKGALFFLGPNASVNASTLSQATYNAAIDTLASDVSAVTGSPKIMVDLMGEVATGSPPDRRSAMDNIRAAILEAVGNNANVLIGPNLIDQNYADDVHFVSDVETQAVADRYWVAIKNGFYSGSLGRGPRIASATLNASKTTVTVTVDRDLEPGTTYGGFRVEESGSPVTVLSATRLTTRTIALALGAPVASAAVTTVTFGGQNDAAGQTVPTSTPVTLPDARTISLPAEPFYDQTVSAETFTAIVSNMSLG